MTNDRDAFDIMYHRVCNINSFRAFDPAYLIPAFLFLSLVFLCADQRLPRFLYFNSDSFLGKKKQIKLLETSINRIRNDPKSLVDRGFVPELHLLGDTSREEKDIAELIESSYLTLEEEEEALIKLKVDLYNLRCPKNTVSGYLTTEIDRKYENSLSILVFLGSLFLAMISILIGSGYTKLSSAQVLFSFSSACAVHMLSKVIMKNIRILQPEKLVKVEIIGFLNFYDLVSILISLSLTLIYLLRSSSTLQNFFSAAILICLLQVLQFKKFSQFLLASVIWYIIQLYSMVRMQQIYGYSLDTFLVEFSKVPLKLQLNRSHDYPLSDIVVTGLLDVLLLGLMIKILRNYYEYSKLARRARLSEESCSCLKNTQLSHVGFAFLVISWVGHSVFLTS